MKKRLISALLTLCMVISLLPVGVHAAAQRVAPVDGGSGIGDYYYVKYSSKYSSLMLFKLKTTGGAGEYQYWSVNGQGSCAQSFSIVTTGTTYTYSSGGQQKGLTVDEGKAYLGEPTGIAFQEMNKAQTATSSNSTEKAYLDFLKTPSNYALSGYTANGYAFLKLQPSSGDSKNLVVQYVKTGSREYNARRYRVFGLVEDTGLPFTDVPTGAYYYKAVDWAYNSNPQVTNGKSVTTFVPSGTCTRGEVVTFLWRAKGCPAPKSTNTPFTDLTQDWYKQAVAWAVEQGITNGKTTTTFAPGETCKGEQIITFIYRAFYGLAASQGGNMYYTKAHEWIKQNGYDADMGFTLSGPCTRAMTVTFLYRALVE